jgi:hypothetical protein
VDIGYQLIGIDGGLGGFVETPSSCRSGSRFSGRSLRADRVERLGDLSRIGRPV